MKAKFLTLFVFFLLGSVCTLKAQDYKSAIGARLGYPLSLSYKTFISEKGAIEGILGFRGYSYYSWITVSALYQHHMPIKSVEGLNWYVGGGASVFFWNYDNDWAQAMITLNCHLVSWETLVWIINSKTFL
ncbi:MAG: hypothetical protein IPI30_08860 [Saprospiraceae bacterium]|nr:hypothetical protein [Candidatus Vicinibacter affinis]